MAKVVIDLKTKDKKLKAEARKIAVNEATGLKSVDYSNEHGDLLVIIAEKIDGVKVVEKIRKAVLPNAELKGVNNQN